MTMSLKDESITAILKRAEPKLNERQLSVLQRHLRGLDEEEIKVVAQLEGGQFDALITSITNAPEVLRDEEDFESGDWEGPEDWEEMPEQGGIAEGTRSFGAGLFNRIPRLSSPGLIAGSLAALLIAIMVAVSYFGSQPRSDIQPVDDAEVLVEPLPFPETALIPAGPNGGAVSREVWITSEFVGSSCYTAVDLNENSRSGEVLTGDKMYTTVEVVGKRSLNNSQVFAVETSSGVCYLPSGALNLETALPQIVDPSELRRIITAVSSLEPADVDVYSKIENDQLTIVTVAAVILFIALILERVVGKDLSQLLLIIPGIFLLQRAQGYMTSVDGVLTIHIIGIWAFVGLGYVRGALAKMQEITDRMQSDSSFDPPKEFLDFFAKKGDLLQNVLKSTNWSLPSWWIGFNIAVGVLYPWESGFFTVLGPKTALLILFVELLTFSALESLKRGESSDVGVFVANLFFGLIVLALVHYGPALGIDLLLWVLGIGFVAMLVLVTLSFYGGFDMFERDRLPDGIQQMAQNVMFAVFANSIYLTA